MSNDYDSLMTKLLEFIAGTLVIGVSLYLAVAIACGFVLGATRVLFFFVDLFFDGVGS